MIKAAILDLDGVVTDTSFYHELAWAQELTHIGPYEEGDYAKYIDGRTRLEAIRNWLDVKMIVLAPDEIETLAWRKDRRYRELLGEHGVKVYPEVLGWLKSFKWMGVKLAVATSSKNGQLLIREAKLESAFDLMVDGWQVEKLGLKSKPAPDIFLYAAEMLEVPFNQCAVFEDNPETLANLIKEGPAYALYCNRGRT